MEPGPNTPSRAYTLWIRSIVVLVLAITAFLSFFPNIKHSLAVAKMNSSQSVITFGLTLHEIDTDDVPNLILKDWQKQYLARHEVPLSLVSLDYIYVPENLIPNGDSLCITEVKVFNESPLDASENIIYRVLVNQNIEQGGTPENTENPEGTNPHEICFAAGKNVVFPEKFQVAPIAYSKYINPFFYPFDTRTMEYRFSSQLYYKNSGQPSAAATEVLMSVSPPRWTTNTNVLFPHEDVKILTTTTYRSPLVKLLSIIIPFSVLLIVFMLPTTTHEAGSFWEVIAGIILGLWGVSEMLIPSYIDYPTLIGSLILILYAVIGVFVINFVAKDFVKRQQLRRAAPTVRPNPLEDIPNEGSIENLFVWAIRKLNEGIESTKIAEALFTKAQNERSAAYKKKLIEVGEKILKS